MRPARPDLLFFADPTHRLGRLSSEAVSILTTGEPSEVVEAVKHERFPILLFDTAHPQYTDSLVLRLYRRTPLSDFWLLAEDEVHHLPAYVIDAVVPPGVTKGEFEIRVKGCLRVKRLLEEYRMVGKSAALKRAAEMISQVAPTDISTLIVGPSGSGKELVARALHQHSARRLKPFVAVNCGALAEGLLESELFGHEKGAFTGAIGRREGIFKRADGGTVFLDEIGETTSSLQVKLLRALEEGSFYRVGGGELVRTDVRIVAATNRDLTDMIAEGKFREDLYYRLGTIRITLAGLYERQADIMPLLNHFFTEQTGSVQGFSERAMELLVKFGWPGNVRQLRSFVSRVMVSGAKGEISEQRVTQFIEEQGYVERHLPVVTGKSPQDGEFQLIYQALLSLGQEVRLLRNLIIDNLPSANDAADDHDITGLAAGATIEDVEENLIKQTLGAVGGNRREAAKKLGIGQRTLYRKLKKYGQNKT